MFYGHTSIGQAIKTYFYQLCADTGCCLEDPPTGMDAERVSRESMQHVHFEDDLRRQKDCNRFAAISVIWRI